MGSTIINIAGHTYVIEQDAFGSWLIEGRPYLEWLETAPVEVVEAAAKKGLEVAVSDPEAMEDIINRVEMPNAQANTIRQFYPDAQLKSGDKAQ